MPSMAFIKTNYGATGYNSYARGGWRTTGGSNPKRLFTGVIANGAEAFQISCYAGGTLGCERYYVHNYMHVGSVHTWTLTCETWGNPYFRATDGDSLVYLYSQRQYQGIAWESVRRSTRPETTLADLQNVQNTQFDWKYNEYESFILATCLGYKSPSTFLPLGEHSAGLASAYLAAVDDIPSNDVNMIENVLDAVSSLSVIRHPSKALKQLRGLTDPKELWLTYRYVLKTGELDYNELRQFVAQCSSIPAFPEIKLRGSYSRGPITYRASGKIQSAKFLNDLKENAHKAFGLDPTLAKLWDVVPYSFIVDWFLPIQDFLSYIDEVGEALSSEVLDVWYSYETSYDGQTTYSRLYGGNGSLVSLPYLNCRQASNRTVVMRVTDSLAIFGK